MEGSILNNLGFDPVYLLIASAVLTLILLVVTVLCLINMRKLYRRYDLFMRGKDAETMENMIVDQMNAIICSPRTVIIRIQSVQLTKTAVLHSRKSEL